MFTAPHEKPKYPNQKPKPHPCSDIQNCSATEPGIYGHRAREPNTNQHVQQHNYVHRLNQGDIDQLTVETNRAVKFRDKFYQITDQRHLKTEIKQRLDRKWKEYEAGVDVRREKLRELFATEERQFVREAVDRAQQGGIDHIKMMQLRIEQLHEKKEEQRRQFVHNKRLDQYMQRCSELRSAMHEKNLKESKYIQQQQMRENEARREADKELDAMWAQLVERDCTAKEEREKQEVILRHNKQAADRKILAMQIEGKRLLKEEQKRVNIEDRIELDKLNEKNRLEEIQKHEDFMKQRTKAAIELIAQIESQRTVLARRRREEEAIEATYAELTRLEMERDQNKRKDNTAQARKEAAQYRTHIANLDKERREEERKLDILLSKYQCEVNQKRDELHCELQRAREKLQRDTMKGRAQQVEDRNREAEKRLQLQQAENEVLRMRSETNDRLMQESKRLNKMATENYREDLSKQIGYNIIQKERENAELRRQMELGLAEEKKYQAYVQEMIAVGRSAGSTQHPFRHLVEKNVCECIALPVKY